MSKTEILIKNIDDLVSIRDEINEVIESFGMNNCVTSDGKMGHIERLVCGNLGITQEEMLRRRRKKEIIYARHLCMFCAATLLGKSTNYETIGARYGGYDHATVCHAKKKFDGFFDVHKEIREQIEWIFSMFKKQMELVALNTFFDHVTKTKIEIKWIDKNAA